MRQGFKGVLPTLLLLLPLEFANLRQRSESGFDALRRLEPGIFQSVFRFAQIRVIALPSC